MERAIISVIRKIIGIINMDQLKFEQYVHKHMKRKGGKGSGLWCSTLAATTGRQWTVKVVKEINDM